jgi:hypothetical protein
MAACIATGPQQVKEPVCDEFATERRVPVVGNFPQQPGGKRETKCMGLWCFVWVGIPQTKSTVWAGQRYLLMNCL